ncbi:monocyte to macrophage differentiation factor [Anopheles ziemanni]|uniref:monocyte to macrophage differentiation factor n=1 Tax=Anopheles coustani TaxID=139045 RepID=UPI002659885B|nr:monocyte to macrophage differentiation factor [Anopheles coustani]XP_058169457.1 monocyte to macrophage differentiation factor [Anopheles ziemanni]
MQDGLISRAGASICNDPFADKGTAKYSTMNGTGTSTTTMATPSAKQYSPTKSCQHHQPRQPPSPTHHTAGAEFKLCGYDCGPMMAGQTTDDGSPHSPGGPKADMFGVLEFWIKLRHDLRTLPWEQLKSVKLKNPRAAPGCAYIPTQVEHIANVLTHGFWILPAIYGGSNLYWRSYTPAQTLAAIIYGVALTMLFFVSTCFHCVCYCSRNRPLKDALHRCDRAMIYIFIAGSYYPWLSLGHTTHPQIVSVVKWCVWVMAVLGIIYQQMYHERYKCLETFFYVVIGLGPSVVIVLWGHEFTGMSELKFGGLLYIVGIVFFKADGLFPFAHAIWHLFVVFAACVHYFAILTHLFPVPTSAGVAGASI